MADPVRGRLCYRLSSDQYNTLLNYVNSNPDDTVTFLSDFHEGIDHFWYALFEDIDLDELDYITVTAEIPMEQYVYLYSAWATGNA